MDRLPDRGFPIRDWLVQCLLSQMKKRPRPSVGPFVVGIVFWGAGMFILTLGFAQFDALTRLFGRGPDYVLLGLTAVLMIVSVILLERIPKKVAIKWGQNGVRDDYRHIVSNFGIAYRCRANCEWSTKVRFIM